MSIPPTSKPQYPNVPPLPGVPPLTRSPLVIFAPLILVTADILTALRHFLFPQWGLFTQGGQPAIVANSINGVEFRRDNRVVTALQEQGAFVSYNKVSDPFRGKITYVQGGTEAERNSFLDSVDTVVASLQLYTLVMPDFSYSNVNATHYDFQRTQRHGTTLLAVDIWIEQIRVTGSSQFSNTNSASGANASNGGTIQPLSPAQNPTLLNVPAAGGLT